MPKRAISIWKAFPFTFLVILAALQAIPRDVYEAAEVDGANRLQALRYVTIPEITPTLLLMAVLMAIFSFKQFTLIWLSGTVATGNGRGTVGSTSSYLGDIKQRWGGIADRHDDHSVMCQRGPGGGNGHLLATPRSG